MKHSSADDSVRSFLQASGKVDSCTDNLDPRIRSCVVELEQHADFSSDRNCGRSGNRVAWNLGGARNLGGSFKDLLLSVVRMHRNDAGRTSCGDLNEGC